MAIILDGHVFVKESSFPLYSFVRQNGFKRHEGLFFCDEQEAAAVIKTLGQFGLAIVLIC